MKFKLRKRCDCGGKIWWHRVFRITKWCIMHLGHCMRCGDIWRRGRKG